MTRGTGVARKAAPAPRRPKHPFKPHAWHVGPIPGVCASCPLPKSNAVHDETAIAAAQAERDERQAELDRRVGDR